MSMPTVTSVVMTRLASLVRPAACSARQVTSEPMPTYDPLTLGPAPRDHDQPFWEPEMQTMPREQLRALQLDRLRTLTGKILDGKAPLFGHKLADAGITSSDDLRDLEDVNRIPTTVKQ